MSDTNDEYLTIESPSKGIFKDKGSKFLAFAYPVFSENEIKPILSSIKKEYFDARHHCFAYCLGMNREIYRTFDDGEPSGTAGKPIFGQINSFNLTNICIVVVRYFGGTLLGTSGLINAYKQATQDVINKSKIITKTIDCIYHINFQYAAINDIMKIIKDENIQLLNQQFNNQCLIEIQVRESKSVSLINKIEKFELAKIEFISKK